VQALVVARESRWDGMRRVLLLGCCLACLSGGVAHAEAGSALVTVYSGGRAAERGIGPVRLNQTRTQVEQALGGGTLVHAGKEEGLTPAQQIKEADYRYRSGSISIEVDYAEAEGSPGGPANVVDSISTSSPSAVLFGHRLARGVKYFEKLLNGRHWHIFRCEHEVFTTLLPGGPGTGIAWKHGRVHEVVIDAGGSWGQQCEG
jgi:hypothetical protein